MTRAIDVSLPTSLPLESDFARGQRPNGAHLDGASGDNVTGAKPDSMPTGEALRSDSPRGHFHREAQVLRAPGDLQIVPEANGEATPRVTAPRVPSIMPGARAAPKPKIAASRATNTHLLVYADAVDDLERTRIATGNRLDSLREVKGFAGTREELELQALFQDILAAEKRATLMIQRAVRTHSFGPWVAGAPGIGEKQAGRLLAAIGDPYIKSAKVDRETKEVLEEERPRRGPAELWAYCGFHVIEGSRPRRAKGEKANWKNTAKMRARLCAESCIKQRCKACTAAAKGRAQEDKVALWAPPPEDCVCIVAGFIYRAVYDAERGKWADRETTDLHKHNHALSKVAKEILKDLWIEGRRLALETDEGMADAA